MTQQNNSQNPNPWYRLAHRAGLHTEQLLDKVRSSFEAKFRPDRPLHIVPYTGLGNALTIELTGRVLRYQDPPESDPATVWAALRANYQRFETDEVPGVRVQARFADATVVDAVTDDEGYFRFTLSIPLSTDKTSTDNTSTDRTITDKTDSSEASGKSRLVQITLGLPDHPGEHVECATSVTLPGLDAQFGVISDIDDTVLVTEATSLLNMMRLTLLGTARTRLAFPGVAAFYRALHADKNPVFYVSSSPWNLYDFLSDFMQVNNLVPGPMLLRDFGLDSDKFIAGSHHDHKLAAASTILAHYSNLPFILVGDSGQKDPEIYLELLEQNPDRILAIYIRDVSAAVRDRQVRSLIARAEALGVPMLLAPDSLAAAVHAMSLGVVNEDCLAQIRSELVEKPKTTTERILSVE